MPPKCCTYVTLASFPVTLASFPVTLSVAKGLGVVAIICVLLSLTTPRSKDGTSLFYSSE